MRVAQKAFDFMGIFVAKVLYNIKEIIDLKEFFRYICLILHRFRSRLT
tara:strand:+ start:1546 stop:1689 length:144 start_codon:yes stop_codon:yes gene_type:complete